MVTQLLTSAIGAARKEGDVRGKDRFLSSEGDAELGQAVIKRGHVVLVLRENKRCNVLMTHRLRSQTVLPSEGVRDHGQDLVIGLIDSGQILSPLKRIPDLNAETSTGLLSR